MKYLHQGALFIGLAATVAMTPFNAQAQTCANASQTPLTKSRLEEIGANEGIEPTRVEIVFERFALSTIKPGDPITPNFRRFPSQIRNDRAGIANVQPDGVRPLTVVTTFPPFLETYEDAVFYEVKAVRRTFLPPSYERYQILGFLDVLGDNRARAEGENPAIVFMTTSDVPSISLKTISEANSRNIGIFHAIACEVPASSGALQIGPTELVNPIVYIRTGRLPADYGGPGNIGRLSN